MTTTDELTAREIRERIGHPLIDGDGHLIEVREAFVRFVARPRRASSCFDDPSARALMVPGLGAAADPAARGAEALPHPHQRPLVHARPTPQDYAAVTMPGLMYERLADTGFDFSVVYPTYGLHLAHIVGDDASARPVPALQRDGRRGLRSVPRPALPGRRSSR